MRNFTRAIIFISIITLLVLGAFTMSRGHPDWFIQTGQFSFADIDTAELAARLGSPVVSYRAGRILYLTGFELDVNDWTYYSSGLSGEDLEHWQGDGGSGAKQPVRGSACAKMTISDTAGGNGVFYNQAIKLLPAIWSGRLGLEFTFAIDENVHEIVLEVSYDDGTNAVIGAIMIDADSEELLYLTGTDPVDIADYTKFADMPGNTLQPPLGVSLRWVNVKLVLSSDLGEFVSFYFNGRSFKDELGGIATKTAASDVAAFERLKIGIWATDDNNSQGVLYFDDVILTQDEP